jgi:hypothetical protein
MSKTILQGLIGAWCPTLGPSGYRLLDRSGRGQHGTLTNMDAGSDWVGTSGGWALDFDGTNDYVTFGNPPGLNTAINLTVSAWLYTRVTTFFELGKYRSNQPGFLLYGATATGFSFDGREGSGAYISSGASGAISTNQWYHVVGRKAGNVWSISVDGLQKNSGTSGTGTVVLSNSNPFEIGRLLADSTPEGYQNGLIGEVAIWNRALTAPEVWQLYQAGRGGLGRLLTPQRRSYAFRVPAAAVKSWLFVNRGQVIGGGTL